MPRSSFSLKNSEAEQFSQLELELLSLSSEIFSHFSRRVDRSKAKPVDRDSHVGQVCERLNYHRIVCRMKINNFFSQPCESEMANM